MALSTISIKDGNGNAVTLLSNNYSGANQQSAVIISDGTNVGPTMDAVGRAGFVKVTDGTNTLPTMDVVGRAGFIKVTDGTNTLPTMDVVGRAGFVKVTDGTNTMPTGDATARSLFAQITDATTGPVFVTPASTAATTANKALVVALSPNTPAITNADAAVTAGTAPSKALLKAVQFLAFNSLPACTTAQTVAAQSDAAGNQKVCVVGPGTPIFLSTTSSATTTAALTFTAPTTANMGLLHGFDVDGLGATAGAIASLTITGLKGTTLTFDVGVPAGATVPMSFSKRFNPPLQGSTIGGSIVINCGAFGAGNTGWSLNAQASFI